MSSRQYNAYLLLERELVNKLRRGSLRLASSLEGSMFPAVNGCYDYRYSPLKNTVAQFFKILE